MPPTPFTAEHLAKMGGFSEPPIIAPMAPGERFLREIARAVCFYQERFPQTSDLVESSVVDAVTTSVLSYTGSPAQAAQDLGQRESDPVVFLMAGARQLIKNLLRHTDPKAAAERVEKFLRVYTAGHGEQFPEVDFIHDDNEERHALRVADLQALIEAVRS